ncbi:DUF1206 domain-containing protein [Rhizobium sp. 32-5/1]|uniref:DUF1206 domain-containing protein n=1 Tax=Rhizobium sp. 32-5/1 TaxID=3019602 RepID=UPI0032B872DB
MIAVGLGGFIAWRLVQAFANADGHPNTVKGYTIRTGMLISGITHLGLATFAASQALSSGSGTQSGGEEAISAWVIAQPFGRYLLAGVGLAVIGAGVAQIMKGYRHGYRKYMDIPATAGTVIDWICLYGLVARGVIFVITGTFFCYAAFAVDPEQAGGMSDALAWVRQLPLERCFMLSLRSACLHLVFTDLLRLHTEGYGCRPWRNTEMLCHFESFLTTAARHQRFRSFRRPG